ncbi:MAG: B12-binding domain-containing radical SAM protein [Candidatus Riflebacteria bacterium]|nr:B12-binding domain-containing radical SAM protein [Candidatus Riflebacteria bacterium]
MKVLLIYPNFHGMNMVPPAIGLFTAILRNDGHVVALFDTSNYKIPCQEDFDSDKEKEKNLYSRPFDGSILDINLNQGDVFQDFLLKISTFQPALLAISCTEDTFPLAVSLLRKLPKERPKVIIGGVFATFAPEKCLNIPQIDMVCVGEGEGPLKEVCRLLDEGKSLDAVLNLWLKKADGIIIRNRLRPPTKLEENPLVDMSLIDDSRFYRPMQGKVWRMLPVETHRGCPGTCTYCNSPSQTDLYRSQTGCEFFRKKSAAAIYMELVYYRDILKADSFYFWADNFFAYGEDDFRSFCEIYNKIRLPFWCQARPEFITEERVRKLMDLGLFRMGFGIEHGNEEFRQKILKRRISNKRMIEVFSLLNDLNLPFSVNNIIGFPTETRELAFDTIEFNRLVKADSHNCYSFSPFHGTTLRKLAENMGFCSPDTIARSLTRPTVLNMPQFPPNEIEGIRRCFVLYVKLPKEDWSDIRRAEDLSMEGTAFWTKLREKCSKMLFQNQESKS